MRHVGHVPRPTGNDGNEAKSEGGGVRPNRRDTAARIGYILRAARKSRGLTQAQIAEALHVSRTAVAGWEAGRRMPDAGTLAKFAELLGVPPETFFRAEVREAVTPSREERFRQLRQLLIDLGATDKETRLIVGLLKIRRRERNE